MSTRMVAPGRHQCRLPCPVEGEVRRCDDCGRHWLGHTPPNIKFWGWTRLGWLRRRLRGIR